MLTAMSNLQNGLWTTLLASLETGEFIKTKVANEF
jgi:hypothetical protein